MKAVEPGEKTTSQLCEELNLKAIYDMINHEPNIVDQNPSETNETNEPLGQSDEMSSDEFEKTRIERDRGNGRRQSSVSKLRSAKCKYETKYGIDGGMGAKPKMSKINLNMQNKLRLRCEKKRPLHQV